MKLRHLIAASMLASTVGAAWAVPADQRVRTMTNPDGSTVQVRVMGDEHFSFYTDVDRTRILEKDSRGFFVDAVRYGSKLKLNAENIEMLRDEYELANPEQAAVRKKVMQKMATLDSSGRSNYPTIGEGNHSMVVLVEFSDKSFSMDDPRDHYTRMLNEPGFSEYGAKGSAIDYYTAISNGKYKPTFDVYGPVKVSHEAAYYDNKVNKGRMGSFIYEAMNNLNDSYDIDFTDYDLDEDGVIDTVYFYYAGNGSADSQVSSIWPHQSDYRAYTPTLKFDGKEMGPYACGNELKGYNPTGGKEPWPDGIGTFVHEYGHVLGLPDMYDANYSGTPDPGDWDVMAGGCYNGYGCVPPLFSAYEQWVCRWLEYTTAEDATHYDMKALGSSEGGAVRIRIPMNSEATMFQPEYFVIETRDNSNVWDSCFPKSGLMVWRINYSRNKWYDNAVNTNGVQNVEILYAKGEKQPLFTEGAIHEGTEVELIPSKAYSMWEHPVISSISYDPKTATGSFDYNMVTPPDIFTVMHDAPLAYEDGSRSFTLGWDKVKDADSYLLTVRTVNNGKIIGGYDNTDVGKVNWAAVEGLSTMYWKLEMEAFVTCVKGGMRSTKTSNVIRFKPSELEMGCGVDEVSGEDSAMICGGVGCVLAPESAEVYTVAGRRVGREGLAPGVYVVRVGEKTTKVIVK